MVTTHNPPQRSKEWFSLRKGKVTGSNAGTLLRQGKQAAIDKNSQTSSGGGYWAKRGIRLEPEALKVYSAMNDDVDIQEVGFVTNDKYPNAGVSPDGVTDVLLEVKCFKDEKHNSIKSGNIPVEIQAQVQFNMLICELSIADLILYNPDAIEPYKVIRIKADKVIQQNIKACLL